MLWRLVSTNGAQAREDTPTYSVWMAKVDAGEVKEVTMYLSPNSYDLQGEYNKPPNMKFQALAEQLRPARRIQQAPEHEIPSHHS